jgi:3-deoxy-8-phosphooctulonate synthase
VTDGEYAARPVVPRSRVRIGEVSVDQDGPFTLIAGPCVIEGADMALRHAERIAETARRAGVPYVFKASYDKANRTSVCSFRGPGLQEGLEILARVRAEVGVPVLTDVHERQDVSAVAEVADVLQIPAFLCRQTDLLLAVCASGRPVNIKKGQFLSPAAARGVRRLNRGPAAVHCPAGAGSRSSRCRRGVHGSPRGSSSRSE